jgi:hypothetical protein
MTPSSSEPRALGRTDTVVKPGEHCETLIVDGGELKFYFKLHTPRSPNPELPDPPYIFIDYIVAEPRGERLLQRYAGEVIARIREKIRSARPIIFQPANGEVGNDEAQARLEAYYLKCGFCYLPSSGSKWWMTWPAPTA